MSRYNVHRSIFNDYRSLKFTMQDVYRGAPYMLFALILVAFYYLFPDYFLLIISIGLFYFIFFGLFFNFYTDTLLEIQEAGINIKNDKEDLKYTWDDILNVEILKDRLPNDPQKMYVIVLYLVDEKVCYFAIKNHFFVSSRTRLKEFLMIMNKKSSNKYQLKTNLKYRYTDSLKFFRDIDHNVIWYDA